MPVNKIVPKRSPFAANVIEHAEITVGTEAGNVINVSIQLQTAKRANLAVRTSLFAYLSDDANGDSIIASAHSTGWAIGTNGVLIPVVANKAAHLVSEANGLIDVSITEAGAKTAYRIVVLPDGSLIASAAITHA